MNTAEFQAQIIDRLDKVVAGAEALMMDGQARSVADFARLKSEIQGLLEVVTAFEKACHGESGLQSVKQTIAALKRTVEAERRPEGAESASGADAGTAPSTESRLTVDAMSPEDDGLSFGFEVIEAEPVAMPSEPVVTEPETVAEEAAVESATEKEAAGPADAKETEKPKEPELGLMFDDGPEETEKTETAAAVPSEEPAVMPESGVVPEPVPEPVSGQDEAVPEPESAPAPEPLATGSNVNEIYETIKQENLAQFSVREEDQPQSYITQLTAMAQAQVKPGEQDMSGVAVSSTARPDTNPEPASSGDSLMDSLRSTRANLYGGQLRTMVDKFKAPQTLYDIQHNRPVDLKMTIGVNEKYLLAQELFGGNLKEYAEAVGRLNDAKDAPAASAVWQALSRQRDWNESSLAYMTFYDLLKRRFPDLA